MSAAERPLHTKVADHVRALIDSGALRAGAAVPTEQQLMDEFGYSRDTVRKALNFLMEEGRISAAQGRQGRKVLGRALMTFNMTHSESTERMRARLGNGGGPADAWVADVTEQGHEPGQQIMVGIERATPEVARLLKLEGKNLVVVRRRVRTVDGAAHNLNDTFYPLAIAENTKIMNPADIPEGVIAYMANELGIIQTHYTDDVMTRMPTPDETYQLGLGRGVPVLIHYRTGFTDTKPVKVTATIWPGDSTRLHWELPA